MTPRGAPITQARIREIAAGPGVVLICGRFEGIEGAVVAGLLRPRIYCSDVLADRLSSEYGVPVSFEPSRYEVMRWISADDPRKLDEFIQSNRFSIARDLDGDPVFMAQSAFSLNYTLERVPEIRAVEIKEMHKTA